MIPILPDFSRARPPSLLTLMLIPALASVTLSIFLPALPEMARDFGVDYGVMQLSVSLYFLATGALQLVIGPLSDRFGRRPVLIGAGLVFLAATTGAMLATAAWAFLLFRMMQAVIATGMALSRTVIRDLVPGERAAGLIGYVTMGMAIAPMLGPAIGGWLGEHYGWRTIFLALLVFGLGVFLLILFDLGETAPGAEGGFRAQMRQWPILLASPRFWAYVLIAAFSSGIYFSWLGGAPHVGINAFGLSQSALGLWMGAISIGYILGNYLSGRFSAALGIVRMIAIGTALTLAGTGLPLLAYLLHLASGPLPFFGPLMLVGIGNGMVLPNTTAGLLSVRPAIAGTAAGFGGAIQIASGGGLAALGGWVAPMTPGPAALLGLMTALATASLLITWALVLRLRRLGLAA